MRSVISRFASDESGTTSVEYAVIAGGIFLAIVTIVYALGPAVEAPFNDAATNLQ
jgi:Flp pilus assembly pilin Flp